VAQLLGSWASRAFGDSLGALLTLICLILPLVLWVNDWDLAEVVAEVLAEMGIGGKARARRRGKQSLAQLNRSKAGTRLRPKKKPVATAADAVPPTPEMTILLLCLFALGGLLSFSSINMAIADGITSRPL
jgi:hypothetical protein